MTACSTLSAMAAVALLLKVMPRVPPVLVKLPTTTVPLRMLAPLKLIPVEPLPAVTPGPILGVSAALAFGTQHGAVPAGVDVQLGVYQGGAGVHRYGYAAFAVGVGRDGVRTELGYRW